MILKTCGNCAHEDVCKFLETMEFTVANNLFCNMNDMFENSEFNNIVENFMMGCANNCKHFLHKDGKTINKSRLL